MSHGNAELKTVEVGLNIGIFSLKGEWKANKKQQEASWELYVELVTRISIRPLAKDEGILREALSSLKSIFDSTREILRRHGADVARLEKGSEQSFGSIAIEVLNKALHPFLTKWHPLLLDYEAEKEDNCFTVLHEKNWSRQEEFREELEELRKLLIKYASLLAKAAEVPSVVTE